MKLIETQGNHALVGIKSRFDHRRLVSMMRVVDNNICVRDKEFKALYDLYSTRYDLHLKGESMTACFLSQHISASRTGFLTNSSSVRAFYM